MAHISSLFLFSKETDAVETVKGFKYQELKTLEVWLSNKIKGVDEEIYCDFEEDIFLRDLNQFKATFKQLKLYSSKNFSFASEEITKALAHFFMLFVKKEYLMDEPTFIFETNTSIAAKKGDNDAELLKEWFRDQKAMSADLLARCLIKLKAIIKGYVESQHSKLVKEGKSEEADEAKSLFEDLPDAVWEAFAKSIEWVFTNTGSDETIAGTIKNIQSFIGQLPFPITRDEQDSVFDKLRGIVSDKSMATDPEDRRLTNDLLVQTLLNMGAKNDKDYIKAFDQWKDADVIDIFRFGEFYEALYMAKHCRRNGYLHEHSEVWLRILFGYYNYQGTPEAQKRELAYELVWLTLRPIPYKRPSKSLTGLEGPVRSYFDALEQFDDISSLEDCLNLLSVIASAVRFGLIDIEETEIIAWHDRFKDFIEKLKISAPNKDYYVSLLEVESFLILNFNAFGYGDEKVNIERLQIRFDDIIKSLPEAKMFSVSQLGGRLDDILELYFKMDVDAEEEPVIEAFSEKLLPFVKARDSDMATAKNYVIKGAGYLKSTNPKGLLKALNFFQKAKELYQNTDANEGFVLALLNISQFYSAIGMNVSAKYYSLSAIWYCMNSRDTALYKRISDAYSLLFSCDFKQGSWINALQNFESYIGLRQEFSPDGFDPSTDIQLRKRLFEAAYILAISPVVSPQLSAFIEYEKIQMGSLYTDLIIDYVEEIKRLMHEENFTVQQVLEGKVDNPPIDDIGGQRVLSWKVFGSTWEVSFENSYTMNSIGEEFTALIQVFLVDIAINDIDLLLLRGEVKIYIELSDHPKAPKQIEDNSTYSWKVYLTKIDVRDSQAINMHYAYISTSLKMILNELSLLPEQNFEELFMHMVSKGVAERALVLNAYQIMYRKIFNEEKFTASMRQNFSSEQFEISRFEIEPLQWQDGKNKMYDSDEALGAIQRRYTKMERKIRLTLNRIMGEPDFQAKVIALRDQGWLDWQILMALMNHIVNLKAHNIIRVEQRTYLSQEEERIDFKKIFEELMQHKDEEGSYVEIPLAYIIDKGLDEHIRNGPGYALKSYGLDNRSRFPNFSAIREFIGEKFNYDKDDIDDLSPFNF